jgi:hypothetical protein
MGVLLAKKLGSMHANCTCWGMQPPLGIVQLFLP